MEFLQIQRCSNIDLAYKILLRDAKKNEETEKSAAITIQRYFRGYRERKFYLIYKYFLKNIKRQLQLLSSKYLLKKLKEQRVEELTFSYLSDHATKIQKVYRGYYSRKYVHDFYRRKQEILEIDKLTKEKYKNMMVEVESRRQKHLLYEQRIKEEKIEKVAKNLHHLVSTKAQKGVYNPKIENIIKDQIKKKSKFEKTQKKK